MRDEILNYFRTVRRIDLLVVALVMLFFGGALVLDRVSSGVHLLLLVLGIHAWRKSGGWAALSRSEQFMLAGFAAWFVVGVISYYFGVGGELGMKILGRDLRFLLAIPVYFILKQAGLTTTHLRIAFALGGVAVGTVAAVQYFSTDLGMARASGRTISILFGHLCASLAMLNLVLSLHDHDRRWMSAIGASGGLLAVWLSGTRGAILLIMLLIPLLLLVKWRRGVSRREILATPIFIMIAATLFLSHGTGFERFVRGFEEGMSYAGQVAGQGDDHNKAMPYCLVDLDWQSRQIKGFHFGGKGNAIVRLENLESPWVNGNVSCTSGVQTIIENSSVAGRARIYWPQRNVPLGATVGASLLLRGRGVVGLAGWRPSDRIQVDTETVSRIDLNTMGTSDTRVLIVLEPGQRIELIPLQIHRSEYAFPGAETSLGSRFYMWQAAWRMFTSDPLLGKGVGGFALTTRQYAIDGSAPTAISRFDHPHNEWMTVLSERGAFGLLALLAIYGLPVRLFFARRDAIGWAGVVFVLSFLLSGLSETIFNHSLGITFYALTVLVLAAARPPTGTSTARSR